VKLGDFSEDDKSDKPLMVRICSDAAGSLRRCRSIAFHAYTSCLFGHEDHTHHFIARVGNLRDVHAVRRLLALNDDTGFAKVLYNSTASIWLDLYDDSIEWESFRRLVIDLRDFNRLRVLLTINDCWSAQWQPQGADYHTDWFEEFVIGNHDGSSSMQVSELHDELRWLFAP